MEFLVEGIAALFTPDSWRNWVMFVIGGLLIFLAIKKQLEPALLLPMGFGAILVNIPFSGVIDQTMEGIGPVRGIIDWMFDIGIEASEALPILLFIGIGAMIDFGPLLANPKLLLFGACLLYTSNQKKRPRVQRRAGRETGFGSYSYRGLICTQRQQHPELAVYCCSGGGEADEAAESRGKGAWKSVLSSLLRCADTGHRLRAGKLFPRNGRLFLRAGKHLPCGAFPRGGFGLDQPADRHLFRSGPARGTH